MHISDFISVKENFILDVSLETACFVLLLIILLTATKDPFLKKGKEYISFIHLVIIEMVLLILDCISKYVHVFLNMNTPYIVLHVLVSLLECALGIICLRYYYYLISEKEQISKKVFVSLISVLVLTAAFIFALNFMKILQLPAAMLKYLTTAAILIADLSLICFFMRFRKSLGIRNFFILLINSCLPLTLYLVTFWPAMPMVLSFNISIFFLYYSIFQTRMKDSLMNEQLLVQKQEETSRAKMKTLLSDIQPEFLQSSLHLIADTCETDPGKANAMTIDLASYLRLNLEASKEDNLILFERDLEHAKIYINTEKKISARVFQVEYDIRAIDFFVPAAFLQPLVRNALENGVLKKERGGVIRIISRNYRDCWVIQVIDNGPGFSTDTELEITKERFKRLTGGSFTFESKPGKGTCITAILPKGEMDIA